MSKLVGTVIVIGFPIFIFIASYLASPDYFAPMLSQALGLVMLGLSLAWLAIGFFVLMVTNGWLRSLMAIVFTTPVILLTMLGPAVITIASALGPVVGSENSVDATSTTNTSAETEATTKTTDTTNGAKKTKTQD